MDYLQVQLSVQARVRDKLASVGVDPDELEGLSDVFEDLPQPFDGLETKYKHFKEKMNMVVSVKAALLLMQASQLAPWHARTNVTGSG